MKKEYVIFNQRLAGFLMMNGFVLKRMERTTKDNSNRNIFIFNDTEQLRQWITTYKK